MRSEGFSFCILGVWGWRRIRFTLHLVSASVGDRPQKFVQDRREAKMAVSIGEAAKSVLFGKVIKEVVMSHAWHFCDIRRVSGGMCARPS